MTQKRENEMIKNIYKYNHDNDYAIGVFTIGTAHRKSIIQLIEKYNEDSQEISWNYSNYDGIL